MAAASESFTNGIVAIPYKCRDCKEDKKLWRRWGPCFRSDLDLVCGGCLGKLGVAVDKTPISPGRKWPDSWVPAISKHLHINGMHFPNYKFCFPELQVLLGYDRE
jgi:hypothetical protein